MTNEIRDRLVELVNTKIDCNKDGHGDCSMCEYKCADENCIKYFSELTVDYLIENDVTIVVKCRNCEYCQVGVDILDNLTLFCNRTPLHLAVDKDGFCNYGKRKAD